MPPFQSTRPRGARRWVSTTMVCQVLFQSTRPRGARRAISESGTSHERFQSTRPRGARRRARNGVAAEAAVSIHAPAWGATSSSSRLRACCPGFNPRARVGRDRRTAAPHLGLRRSFNPRARVGRDPTSTAWIRASPGFNPRARVGRDSAQAFTRSSSVVSIHAPAWGATVVERPSATRDMFQSTRPRGARHACPRPER